MKTNSIEYPRVERMLGMRCLTVMVAMLFLVVANSISQVGLMTEEIPLSFEVRGLVSWEIVLSNTHYNSEFCVTVKGAQWRIDLQPLNWPSTGLDGVKHPLKLKYEIASDGTNVYEISQYSPKDLPSWQVEQFAERWGGALPMDRGSHSEAHALWYAFASSRYCASITGQTLMTLEPRGSNVNGTIQRHELPPGLPARILATNVDGSRHWGFSVGAFTNCMGIALPQRGSLDGYQQSRSNPWSIVRFEAHQIVIPAPPVEFRLEIDAEKSCGVLDTTHRHDVRPFTARFRTNQWPSEEEVLTAGKTQKEIRKEVTSQPKGAWKRGPVLMVLGCLLIGPIVFAICFLRWSCRLTNKGTSGNSEMKS